MTDPFDTVKSSFLGKEDVKDCLIAYIALGPVEKYTASDQSDVKPGEPKKTYDFVKAAVAVLEGKPSKEFTDEHGTALPVVLDEFGFSGVKLVDKVARTLKTKRPAVMWLRHTKNKRGGYSFVPEEPTAEDLKRIAKHAAVAGELIELQAAAIDDPFDSE